MSKYQVIIGRFEYVDITDGLCAIPAKIDTGANRSSIHASKIHVVTTAGKEVLHFTLLNHPTHPEGVSMSTDKFSQMQVKSSNGHISTRYEIKLKIKLGYKVFVASFTLADRSNNVFPILIGREALRTRFLVDPERAGVKRSELKSALAKTTIVEDIEGVNV